MEPVKYVCNRLKNILWKKLMVNFTLPEAPEVDRTEEDPNEEDSDDDDHHLNIIERKVKSRSGLFLRWHYNSTTRRKDCTRILSTKKRLWCSLDNMRR
jgi:hypothetical protein